MKKQYLEAVNLLKQKRRDLDNYTCGFCRKTNSSNVVLSDPMTDNRMVLPTTNLDDLTTTCRHCCAIIVNYAYGKWPLTCDIEAKREAEKKALELAENHKRYTDYIGGSRKWELLRQERMKKDNGSCTKCHSTSDLHVHHVTYDRLFNENLDDLVTLCRRCHKKEHEEQALRRAGLI